MSEVQQTLDYLRRYEARMTHEQAYMLTELLRQLKNAFEREAPVNQVMTIVHQLAKVATLEEATKGSTQFWVQT